VVPDVGCHAGSVTVSYFKGVQDMASVFWSEEEVSLRMDRIMIKSMSSVLNKANEKACSLCTAASIVACAYSNGASGSRHLSGFTGSPCRSGH